MSEDWDFGCSNCGEPGGCDCVTITISQKDAEALIESVPRAQKRFPIGAIALACKEKLAEKGDSSE